VLSAEGSVNILVGLALGLGLLCLALAALGGIPRAVRLGRVARLGLAVIGLGLLAWGSLLPAPWLPPPPTSAEITFEALPDGTPISEERFLRGDEFESLGIRLAGAPESGYCAEGTAAAVRVAGRYGGVDFNFLTAADPHDIDRCNGVPVEITFTEPVRQIRLNFAGASQVYTLRAYGEADRLLGSAQAQAVFQGGTFEIAFASTRADIRRVTFGRELSITAIRQIAYER